MQFFNRSRMRAIRIRRLNPAHLSLNLHAKVDELTKFIGELEYNCSRIQTALFGSVPEEAANLKSATEPPVADKIAWACTRAAQLCGFTSTIAGRLGQ